MYTGITAGGRLVQAIIYPTCAGNHLPVACEANVDNSAAHTGQRCELVFRTPEHQQAATVCQYRRKQECVIYPHPGLIAAVGRQQLAGNSTSSNALHGLSMQL